MNEPGHVAGEEAIPFPPDEYMLLVCGPTPLPELHEMFRFVGNGLAEFLDRQQMLGPDVRLLDVGCGCGRVARHLLTRPLASYIGFDRHPGMIDWCRREITRRDPRFAFLHCDVKSAYDSVDSQYGSVSAAAFEFPFPADSFDGVLLSSVFTHMPLDEVRRYLSEIYRVLSGCGKVLLSAFLSESDDYVIDGLHFFPNREKFLDAVSSAGFACRFIRKTGDPGKGGEHHWFALSK
jgi:ubiquinone/menaquinone biosynthesis C-methylase UbiE